MALSNIRFSNANKIVLDNNYNERTAGTVTRKVNKVKIMALPTEKKNVYLVINCSPKGKAMMQQFAKENGLTLIYKKLAN